MTAREVARRCLIGGTVGVIATVMYHGTQYLGATRATVRSDCASWHWLAFRPEWLGPYDSVFLLVGVPWFSLRSWASVRNFGVSLIVAASIAWVTFVVYPTACVRPSLGSVPFYIAALYQVDWPNNCFPCLHAMFAVLGAYGSVCSESHAMSLRWRFVFGVWSAVILMSTIALRQHTGIDVLAGLVLGGVAIFLFRRLNARWTEADRS